MSVNDNRLLRSGKVTPAPTSPDPTSTGTASTGETSNGTYNTSSDATKTTEDLNAVGAREQQARPGTPALDETVIRVSMPATLVDAGGDDLGILRAELALNNAILAQANAAAAAARSQLKLARAEAAQSELDSDIQEDSPATGPATFAPVPGLGTRGPANATGRITEQVRTARAEAAQPESHLHSVIQQGHVQPAVEPARPSAFEPTEGPKAPARTAGWIEEQNRTYANDTRVRDPAPRPAKFALDEEVKFENRDVELLSSRLERAITRSKPEFTSHRHIPELPHFDGSITEWIVFKSEFLDTESSFSDVANVGRIRRALRGDARHSVKALLYTSIDPYEIVDMLEMQFGNPEGIVLAEIDEVRRLPRLSDDNSNITAFAGQVANVVATIKSLKQEQYLLAPELVGRLVEKLNPIMRYEWNKYRVCNTNVPGLVALAKFLSESSRAAGLTYIPGARRPSARPRHNVNNATHRRNNRSYSRSSSRESYTEENARAEKSTANVKKHTVAQLNKTSGHTKAKPPFKPRPPTTAPGNARERCSMCSGEHPTAKCADFIKLTVNERWDKAKQFKLCFRCLGPSPKGHRCGYTACGIGDCEAAHNKLLHGYKREGQPRGNMGSINHLRDTNTYLKVIPIELSGPLGTVHTYGLMDEGSSLSLIERHVADKLAPRTKEEQLSLGSIANNVVRDNASCQVNVSIRGLCSREFEKLSAYTIDQLSLSPQAISKEVLDKCPHLESMRDELCYDNAVPTVLIGQDNWHLIVTRQLVSSGKSLPVASLTKLGWVLHGRLDDKPRTLRGQINHLTIKGDAEAYELIKRHFSIESLGVEPKTTRADPDQRALQILESTCAPIPGEPRYQVGLLWKSDEETLPDNKQQALKRLFTLERKLDKDESLKAEFSKQITNLLDKGYAEKIDAPLPSPRGFYLPYFHTIHPTKQKVRLVFDGKCRTAGKSLNDALLSGPDLLQSLFGVLIRFREGRIGIIADIKEMFLQIKVIEQDRDSLRFLWRGGRRSGPADEYRMSSLIFGSSASPTTAIYVKNKNAERHADKFPLVHSTTLKNFYVDDLLVSFDDPAQAKQLVNDMVKVFNQASFTLRSWASNVPEVLSDVTDVLKSDISELGRDECERTLGLLWNNSNDTLGFNVNFRNVPSNIIDGTVVPTKRQVTAGVMSLFDPVGLISPVSVTGKVLIQRIWRSGIDWDTQIAPDDHRAWLTFVNNMRNLHDLHIKRHVPSRRRTVVTHTFCDASESAYACAVYMVDTDETGKRQSSLVAAKARVCPLKNVSIPRLELQSATLASRLTHSVKRESDYVIEKSYYWSDSKTVLAWIRADPRTFKCFVAHRLAEIEDTTSPCDWRWVPSALNVADDATRDIPANFNSTHRWFRGPEFILLDPEHWPVEKPSNAPPPTTGEERTVKPVNLVIKRDEFAYLPDVNRFSKYLRLLRASSRVLVAAEKFKAIIYGLTANHDVTNDKLKLAELLLIKRSQRESFRDDIALLEAGRRTPKKSPLNKLAVTVNKHGILLLDGRIDRDRGTPVLHAKEALTRLIIAHYHALFNHANHSTVMNELNTRFHIVGLRGATRYISNTCQWCRTYRGTPLKVPLGDLPSERLTANQPAFTATACDYFGPMSVTVGRRHEKRWGALYTCLTTRAVHLELVPSLSASSMILSLRRLMARRGQPTVLYTDNATCFYGAERELAEAVAANEKEVEMYAVSKQIVWKKIPPGNPSAGGAWERLVGSVKAALRVTLKEKHPADEILHTLLLEAEHIVNSRPLIPVRLDDSQEALTPNHFLLGRSNAMTPLGHFDDAVLNEKSWKTAQALADRFWSRWTNEYRQTLRPRTSPNDPAYRNVQIGDIVIIVDGTMPRSTWPRGEVAQVYPGPDGKVRVTEVRTAAGMIRRPASRLIVI